MDDELQPVKSIAQRSPEWFAARLGKATASRISDIIAKTKTGWGASRANYAAELIAERLTGKNAESYINTAMQWGIDTEFQARIAYEAHTLATVQEIGFIAHPRIPMSGASPDGLVGAKGMVELKCPNTATHIDTLLGQEIPKKYIVQMQWQMACAGRTFCDFVSFDPRMPESMRFFRQRVDRDEDLIRSLEKDVIEFLAEIDKRVSELKGKYGI